MKRGLIKPISTLIFVACLFAAELVSKQASATPWIEADDPYLRISLQQLADAGYLRTNVSTYPLMWHSISSEMRDIRVSSLTESEMFAYYRVSAALEFAQQPTVKRLQLRAASDEYIQQGFGVRNREQAALTVSRGFTSEHMAGRLQTTVKSESVDGKSYSFEGSYVATTLGNWALSIDQLDVWWGPGHETALVLSSNAMPIQAIRLNRLDTRLKQASTSWLPELGHLHLSTFLGRSQRAGSLGDHPVFGARLSWRPLAQLEFGASYSGQWGGEGYSNDASGALDVIVLKDNEDVGNQIGGVDVRIALLDKLGLYGEVASNNRNLEDSATTLGLDFRFSNEFQLRELFLEHTEVPERFYNDYRDPAGYRRYGMSMGSGQDQDVKTWTVGYRHQYRNGTAIFLRLQHLDYGHTNQYIVREYDLGSGDRVKRRQANITYQQAIGDSLLKLQIAFTTDKLAADGTNQSADEGLSGTVSWEVRF